MSRHGQLVTKDELLQLVWPDTFVEENNLAQNISALRRVLGDGTGGERFIETVPKRGYRFVAPVTEPRLAVHTRRHVPPEPLYRLPRCPPLRRRSGGPGRRGPIWVAIAVAGLALIVVGVR